MGRHSNLHLGGTDLARKRSLCGAKLTSCRLFSEFPSTRSSCLWSYPASEWRRTKGRDPGSGSRHAGLSEDRLRNAIFLKAAAAGRGALQGMPAQYLLVSGIQFRIGLAGLFGAKGGKRRDTETFGQNQELIVDVGLVEL